MTDDVRTALGTIAVESAKLVVTVGVTLLTKEAIVKGYAEYDRKHTPLPPKKWWETKSGYNKRNGLA